MDWQDENARSTLEMNMNDKFSRPTIADKNANIEMYDVVFVGFPICWYIVIVPTIIKTFLESCDFARKTIVLFVVSGSSGFGKTVENLKDSVPELLVSRKAKF